MPIVGYNVESDPIPNNPGSVAGPHRGGSPPPADQHRMDQHRIMNQPLSPDPYGAGQHLTHPSRSWAGIQTHMTHQTTTTNLYPHREPCLLPAAPYGCPPDMVMELSFTTHNRRSGGHSPRQTPTPTTNPMKNRG